MLHLPRTTHLQVSNENAYALNTTLLFRVNPHRRGLRPASRGGTWYAMITRFSESFPCALIAPCFRQRKPARYFCHPPRRGISRRRPACPRLTLETSRRALLPVHFLPILLRTHCSLARGSPQGHQTSRHVHTDTHTQAREGHIIRVAQTAHMRLMLAELSCSPSDHGTG